VPRSILYDNTKLAVARILGDRLRTRVFSELQSHYLFTDRFGRPGKGNDKGKVEGLVGYARRNFMVPIPRAAGFAELNAQLLERCRRRRLPMKPATGGRRESVRSRWCATGVTTVRCRPPTVTARCWSAVTSTKW
jgi:transposase